MPDPVKENPINITPATVVEVVERAVTRPNVEAVQTSKPAESTEPNTFLGSGAGASLTAKGEGNTLEGKGAGESLTTGSANTMMGVKAGAGVTTGNENVIVGNSAGKGISSTAAKNTIVGTASAEEITGSGNVFVGWSAVTGSASISNKLVISNNSTTSIIQGVMSETAGSIELGFFNHAVGKQPEVTGGTVTAKVLAEALATIGLVKVN